VLAEVEAVLAFPKPKKATSRKLKKTTPIKAAKPKKATAKAAA
jgi:hypothetical protein